MGAAVPADSSGAVRVPGGRATGDRRGLRRARLSTAAIFFLVGFAFATWAARVPVIRDDLALSNGQLAIALVGFNSGVVLAPLVVGGLVVRLGSRTVLIASMLWYVAALPLVALAPALPALVAAMLLLAVGNCGLDVAMNAQGSLVERGYGRPVLTSFHAAFSVGALAGGAVGAVTISARIGTPAHFTAVAGMTASVAAVAVHGLLRDAPSPSTARRGAADGARRSFPTSAIVLPGAVCFCAMMGEGVMNNWSALYLRDVVGSDGAAAAIGITAFAIGMTAGRLTADGVHRRVGTGRFLVGCGVIAAIGAVLVLVPGAYATCLVGAVVLGLGLAAVVPVVFGHSAARDPARSGSAIAKVTAIGYTGFFVGPPVVGGLAQVFGLRAGMVVLPLLMLLMIVLIARLRRTAIPPRAGVVGH
ncbi:MFS transporter [Saccharothrix australiensis]|uniref:MFS transporter n=1 Tax=Saccharothrix australiensis TaxID=2072 RepID=UPI001476D0EC|nr:MFS transporter [Saccharothrix australiensis]